MHFFPSKPLSRMGASTSGMWHNQWVSRKVGRQMAEWCCTPSCSHTSHVTQDIYPLCLPSVAFPTLFNRCAVHARSIMSWGSSGLTVCVSPAACLRCCPIGDSVGTVFVVNLLVNAPRTSLVVAMFADHRLGLRWDGGDSGLVVYCCCSSRGDCAPR